MRQMDETAGVIYTGVRCFRDGAFVTGDVAVAGGRFVTVAAESGTGEARGSAPFRRIDAAGLWLLPGLVDVHVHLREPGFSAKETIATGTAAAAHGGYTTVCAMPNLNPAPDCIENLERELELIRRDARVRVIPYATITRGRKGRGEVVDFEALKPYVAGFSDDGTGVQERATMLEAMRRAAACDARIVAHCEVDELLRGGYIHDGDYCRRHNHRGICSESEWRQVERDLELAAATGCRYHVCHISTRESVELIRQAKASGVRVSCETAPHYLLLCDADLQEEGRFKMNPPLRSRADQEALLEGLQDGTVDVIATDHAPHTAEEKSRGLAGSAMGIVGLETAFPLLLSRLVGQGIITAERLVEAMSEAPRRLFGFGGGVQAGEAADFTLVDPAAGWRIDPDDFLSMGRSTPFAGWEVRGRILLTAVGGRTVWADTNWNKQMTV